MGEVEIVGRPVDGEWGKGSVIKEKGEPKKEEIGRDRRVAKFSPREKSPGRWFAGITGTLME